MEVTNYLLSGMILQVPFQVQFFSSWQGLLEDDDIDILPPLEDAIEDWHKNPMLGKSGCRLDYVHGINIDKQPQSRVILYEFI